MTAHAEQDLLLDLAYGELSAREARRLRAHVDGCADCRAELARIEGTRELFSALPEVPAPEAGERILLAAAREAADRVRPPRRLPRWLVPATALAATVAVVTAVALRQGGEVAGPLHRGDDRDALMRAAAPSAEPAQAPDAAPDERAAGRGAADGKVAGGGAAGRESKDTAFAKAPPPAEAPRRATREAPANLAPALSRAPAAPAERLRSEEATPAAGEVVALSQEAQPAKAEAEGYLAARKAAAPAAAAPGPSAAAAPAAAEVAASRSLEADGPPPVQVQTFPGCAGETRREIGRDALGRVVRYAREGASGGRRVRVELAFGPDGELASARARDLDTGEVLAADVLAGLPRAAAQVDPDAAPHCGP